LPTAFRERCQTYVPCELVEDAAWNEVVIEGDEIDLTKLPIPLQFTVDGGPYITAGQLSARDPVTGVDTTGFHRLMLRGKNRLGTSLHSRRRMYEFQRRAEERGQSLPAAITIGTHPLHYMGSMVYAYPPQVRKFEIIGGLFGEPYRLARSGVNDLEVPAGAEIIIEGEILAHVHEPEGPFGEFTGYASYRSTQNVFVAHRIRMRRDAMLHSVTSGMSRDHILVSCITREGEILNALRRNLPNVRAVHVPHTTCGAFMAFVSMKKIAEGEPQMAIMATLGTELYTKYVIVVDDDVDIFNMDDAKGLMRATAWPWFPSVAVTSWIRPSECANARSRANVTGPVPSLFELVSFSARELSARKIAQEAPRTLKDASASRADSSFTKTRATPSSRASVGASTSGVGA